jgi:hypothetical protein
MFDFGDFSISWREVLISVVIIAVMIVFGLMIHGSIEDSIMLKNQEYNLALQIDNNGDMFEYGMRTNIGNAFVYGTLKCLDPVTFEEIGGQYSAVEKVKERYTRHTRLVTETYTDAKGNVHTRTKEEVYWTWDAIDRWAKYATRISFVGVEFDYGTISFGGGVHITTIKESSHIRYVYYGAPIEVTGTLYTKLENNTINQSSFHRGRNIEETHKYYTSSGALIWFWIGWTFLIGILVFGFIYIDNHWLHLLISNYHLQQQHPIFFSHLAQKSLVLLHQVPNY